MAPILYAVPVQLSAYHAAVAEGTDVDRPRNLAKSVTVEQGARSRPRPPGPVLPAPSSRVQPFRGARSAANLTMRPASSSNSATRRHFRESRSVSRVTPGSGGRLAWHSRSR